MHNNSLLHQELSVKKQLDPKDPRQQLRSARTVSRSCDAFVVWFAVGSVRRYYALTIARRSGRISGADLDPVPCQGHSAACLQSSLLWMLCCDEGSVVSVLFETWLRILSKNLFHNHYLATCLPHQQWYCFVWMPSLNLGFWLVVALHFW